MSEIDLCLYLCVFCFQCGDCIGDDKSIGEVKEEKELRDYHLIEDKEKTILF